MAFKTAKDYNEERYGDMFILRNDGDYADVIFLYQSEKDVLVADTHYVKSDEYSGYVHCLGRGCPACAKGLRTQTKLFIPLYNVRDNSIRFFDRTMRFEPQLQSDVFSRFPNPSEFIWRITRRGAASDVNTKYEIMALGPNNYKSYDQIMSEFHTSFPDHYSHICREIDTSNLSRMLSGNSRGGSGYSSNDVSMPSYTVTPRGVSSVTPSAPPAYNSSNTPLPEPSFEPGDMVEPDDESVDFN